MRFACFALVKTLLCASFWRGNCVEMLRLCFVCVVLFVVCWDELCWARNWVELMPAPWLRHSATHPRTRNATQPSAPRRQHKTTHPTACKRAKQDFVTASRRPHHIGTRPVS